MSQTVSIGSLAVFNCIPPVGEPIPEVFMHWLAGFGWLPDWIQGYSVA